MRIVVIGSSTNWELEKNHMTFDLQFSLLYSEIYNEIVRKFAQSWQTLFDPRNCSLQGSFFHGIL